MKDNYRNSILSNKLAFGCSHTWGVGVDEHEAWPSLLGAMNFGVAGCSADLIARIFEPVIIEHCPTTVYILWPNWTRFEYMELGVYKQSLATDPNRMTFMSKATDDWLHENFETHSNIIRTLCSQYRIKLVELTLDDLVPYIDHADKWPISRLGHNDAPTWHSQVATIFENIEYE